MVLRPNQTARFASPHLFVYFFLSEQHFLSCPVTGSSRHHPRLSKSPSSARGHIPREESEREDSAVWPGGGEISGPTLVQEKTSVPSKSLLSRRTAAKLPVSLRRGSHSWRLALVGANGGWNPGRADSLESSGWQRHSGPGHQQPRPLPGQGGWPVSSGTTGHSLRGPLV